jgi:hypothetical protein
MFPRNSFISSVERKLYFFFLGLVCESALPATDLEDFEVLPSFKIFEAIEATLELVCFLLDISLPPFRRDDIL